MRLSQRDRFNFHFLIYSVSLSLPTDQTWKKADAASRREQIAQEAMNVLREKLEKLQKEAEKFSGGDTSEE